MFPLDALEAMDLLAGLKRAKHIAAHLVLQVWDMRQADVRLHREDEPVLKHDQDLRAD